MSLPFILHNSIVPQCPSFNYRFDKKGQVYDIPILVVYNCSFFSITLIPIPMKMIVMNNRTPSG